MQQQENFKRCSISIKFKDNAKGQTGIPKMLAKVRSINFYEPINFRRIIMTKHEFQSDYHDSYEYHGSTAIEITRKQDGITIKRDWILFDSVEEAQDFFYDNCSDFRGYYV